MSYSVHRSCCRARNSEISPLRLSRDELMVFRRAQTLRKERFHLLPVPLHKVDITIMKTTMHQSSYVAQIICKGTRGWHSSLEAKSEDKSTRKYEGLTSHGPVPGRLTRWKVRFLASKSASARQSEDLIYRDVVDKRSASGTRRLKVRSRGYRATTRITEVRSAKKLAEELEGSSESKFVPETGLSYSIPNRQRRKLIFLLPKICHSEL